MILTIMGCDRSKKELSVNGNENAAKFKSPKVEELKKTLHKDFVFDLGTRFTGIKKEDLLSARSFADFIGDAHISRIMSYSSLSVTILEDGEPNDIKETGESGDFTPAQLKLLRTLDYSTNLMIRADYMEKRDETGLIEKDSWTPYLTVVPETQAAYSEGKEKLINYFIENSDVNSIEIVREKLKSARLYFTVTKNGTIENVNLSGTSGYPIIDDKMIELIGNAPGTWIPAQSFLGEKVDQELVISFGTMGC